MILKLKESIKRNKCLEKPIRLMVRPWFWYGMQKSYFKAWLRDKGLKKFPEFDYLLNWKDSHKGERCFIVATVPSLTIEDLNLIKNEFSLSMNSGALLMEKTECDIFSLRFIKPFDYSYFEEIAEKYDALLLAEDGVKKGGFGEEWLISVKKKFPEKKVSVLGFPDAFPANGTRAEILAASGLDRAGIASSARALLEE